MSESQPDIASVRGIRCLVVEDDPIVCDAYVRLFQRRGASVVVARTVPSARRAIQEESFDLAIVDIGLRGEDGRVLVEPARDRGIGVCVVSALWDDDSRTEAERAGVLTLDKAEISNRLGDLVSLAAQVLEGRPDRKRPLARTGKSKFPGAKANAPRRALAPALADDPIVRSLEPAFLCALTEFATDHLLTDGEFSVLVGRLAGLADKDIAERMEISPNTVGTHRRSAARKAGTPWPDLVARFAREAHRRSA